MVSFDVKSLFTSVSLTKTIDIMLHRVYNRKKKSAVLTKIEMKKLVSLCTKNYLGYRLGPILANVFIVDLKTL